jgi:hypothetical protein
MQDNCLYCDKSFMKLRSTMKFCGSDCRNKYYYQNHIKEISQ